MKYICDVCGWEYDEEKGYPEGGIAPGTKWEDVPDDFECPLCSVGKDQFSAEEYLLNHEEVINDTPLEDQRGIFSKEQTVYTLPVSYYRKVGMIRGRVYKKGVRRIT